MNQDGIDTFESGGREFGEVGPGGQAREDPGAPPRRPSLQVYFRCSNTYIRVLRSADGSHYLCRCPSCGKSTRFVVGSGGTEQRFFEMSCR